MNKKLLKATIIATVGATLITGCSKKDNSSDKKDLQRDRTKLEEMINEKEKDSTVNIDLKEGEEPQIESPGEKLESDGEDGMPKYYQDQRNVEEDEEEAKQMLEEEKENMTVENTDKKAKPSKVSDKSQVYEEVNGKKYIVKGNNRPTTEEDLKRYKNFSEANNKFAFKTFKDMLNGMKPTIGNDLKYTKNKNLVYSPYSYSQVVSLINKYGVNMDSSLSKILGTNDPIEYPLNNIDSQTKLVLNKSFFKKLVKDTRVMESEFPTRAENISSELQKNILGEVLSTPDYEKDTQCVFINATRFYGKWNEKFDKKKNTKEVFKTINPKDNQKNVTMMNQIKDCGLALDTKDAVSHVAGMDMDVKNPIKKFENDGYYNRTSNVYIVVPKTDGLTPEQKKDKIVKVGNELEKYIGEDKYQTYEVDLSIPKLKTKTTIQLDKIGEDNKYGIDKGIKFNDKYIKTIKSLPNRPLISQVASLEMDEEKVEAKAVTEAVFKTTAIMENKKIKVKADKPYFVVITSKVGYDMETITFMSLINQVEK